MTGKKTKEVEENLLQECKEEIPKDRYNAAYIIFYLLGCLTLLPWNFFITANEYFSEKFKPHDSIKNSFQNYFSVVSMAPNLLMMILNVFFMHRYSRKIRTMVSIIFLIIVFGITSCFVLVDTESWTKEFFILTLAMLLIMTTSASALQGALFGLAGMFPSKYIQGVMAGQGLGGFFVCAVSILSMFGERNVKRSSFGYFCTGTVAMVVALFAYTVLEKLPIVRYYAKNTDECFCTCKCESGCHKTVMEDKELKIMDKKPSINYLKIIRQIKTMMFSVYFTFFVTLSIFPSTTARILSTSNTQNRWTESFFVPVGCFLMYNLFDYLGKSLPTIFLKPSAKHPYVLVVFAVSRILFIPLFILCNVQPRTSGIPVVFGHDAYPFIFMALFALSGGYLGTLPFVYGPRCVEPQEAEIAATLLVFSLVAGLASGSAFSFAIAPNI